MMEVSRNCEVRRASIGNGMLLYKTKHCPWTDKLMFPRSGGKISILDEACCGRVSLAVGSYGN
jgi:hypothetical protein